MVPVVTVVDDVSCSGAEQYTMAEKDRLFQDKGAAECRRQTHTSTNSIGRGVHNFDCAIWDRFREDAVFAGTFAKFTLDMAMTEHLLSTGTKLLAAANLFDPVLGIILRSDTPDAQRLFSGVRK